MFVDHPRHTGGEVEGRELHERLDVAAQRYARAGDAQRTAGESMLLQEVRDGAVRHLSAGAAIVAYGQKSDRRIEDPRDVARVGYEGRRQTAEEHVALCGREGQRGRTVPDAQRAAGVMARVGGDAQI